MRSVAYLDNREDYTIFTFNDHSIRFLTGKNLIRYLRVKEWDHGYLVVDCLNRSDPNVEIEDYIDLIPILKNLLIDPVRFLDPITEVKIADE